MLIFGIMLYGAIVPGICYMFYMSMFPDVVAKNISSKEAYLLIWIGWLIMVLPMAFAVFTLMFSIWEPANLQDFLIIAGFAYFLSIGWGSLMALYCGLFCLFVCAAENKPLLFQPIESSYGRSYKRF